jgi:hypothetical protein
MRKSVMRLLAAMVMVVGIVTYQEQHPLEASGSCWVIEWACYLNGGYWIPVGSGAQCWDGYWHAQYMCINAGVGGPFWCNEGQECSIGCGPNGCDA